MPTPKIMAQMKIIHLRLYSMPELLKDSKRAKMVAKMRTTVAHAEMTNCPHSKYLALNYLSHLR